MPPLPTSLQRRRPPRAFETVRSKASRTRVTRRVIRAHDDRRMTALADYETRYANVVFERDEDGVLLMRFHTDGGPLKWSEVSHRTRTSGKER